MLCKVCKGPALVEGMLQAGDTHSEQAIAEQYKLSALSVGHWQVEDVLQHAMLLGLYL